MQPGKMLGSSTFIVTCCVEIHEQSFLVTEDLEVRKEKAQIFTTVWSSLATK
jgi:hypothetical protein